MRDRVISIVLVLIILISSFPEMAWADEPDFVIEDGVLTAYLGPGGDVQIPDNVTTIGRRSFFRCTSVTSVLIPDSVRYCTGGFGSCSSLSTIKRK